MATPRLFAAYPEEYTKLLRAAMKVPIRFDCKTKEIAVRWRGTFYAFRYAIVNAPAKHNIPDDLRIIAPLIRFKIDHNTLIIYHRLQPLAIQKALKNVRSS